ncbi:MAG TPA: 50S ribosomal protein L11 methyltransferase [Nitrospirota bacterium]|nr:50S ribosomal protein L11 methyltransferase [Nitrospirota bacterium]
MPYYEFTITIADRFKDRLIKKLMDSGCLGVIDQDKSFIAYFPSTADVKTIENELSLVKTLLGTSGAGPEPVFASRLIPDEDWNESWKKSFSPIDAGKSFTILPPWEERRKGRINLVIDPAMAFGTGHHETTRSCLALMEKYAADSGTKSFLDVGTGTGILAIAGVRLGFKRVVAVDTDILAVDAARTNCGLNDASSEIEIREGSIEDLSKAFDVIAANLISGVLVQLAPAIASHLKKGGVAILSGILTGQDVEVVASMTRAGLSLLERYHDGKWTSLVVRK